MSGDGDGPGTLEEQIAALLETADEELGVDLDEGVVEESATVEKVVAITPFEQDSAVDVTKRRSYDRGEVTLEVKKRIRCPECGYVCTGPDGPLHPSMCPECNVRFTDLRDDVETGALGPTDEEELLMAVNEHLMKTGEAPTESTCVAEAPFGQAKTKRMLRELTEAGRLTAETVERDGRAVTVYRPP